MLSKSAQTDDIQRFTELASAFTEPGDKEKADAVYGCDRGGHADEGQVRIRQV